MNYSYVMGMSKDILELKKYGFIIENDNNNYMISFKNDKKQLWENFIYKNLENGYWNEYIGDDIVFIFKFNDGNVKKYILDCNNQDEILKLCCKFANTDFSSIQSMLLGNKFYNSILKDNMQFSDLVEKQ